jgi:hypothetical protein
LVSLSFNVVTCLDSLFIRLRIESCSSSKDVPAPERVPVLVPLPPVVLAPLDCSSAVLMMVGSGVVVVAVAVVVPFVGLLVPLLTGFVTRRERLLRRCCALVASMKHNPTDKRTIKTNKR